MAQDNRVQSSKSQVIEEVTCHQSDQFPQGWFYISCPSRQGQVLTVPNGATQPSTRVELRPKKKIGATNDSHQLWCYHNGYLVNKNSGCVLGAEKDKFKDQYVYQSKRSLVGSNDRKRQIWKLNEEGKLILTDDKHGLFALNDLAVPKLEELEKGCTWILAKRDALCDK